MPDTVALTRDVLRGIEASRGDLPDALARIADVILSEPEVAVRASMSELAELTGSGEASIVRFCRRLGFDGYSSFKLSLASDIAYRHSAEPRGTDAGYRWPQYAAHRGQLHMLLYQTLVDRAGAEAVQLGAKLRGAWWRRAMSMSSARACQASSPRCSPTASRVSG